MLFFFTFDYIYVYLMKIVIFYEKYHSFHYESYNIN